MGICADDARIVGLSTHARTAPHLASIIVGDGRFGRAGWGLWMENWGGGLVEKVLVVEDGDGDVDVWMWWLVTVFYLRVSCVLTSCPAGVDRV